MSQSKPQMNQRSNILVVYKRQRKAGLKAPVSGDREGLPRPETRGKRQDRSCDCSRRPAGNWKEKVVALEGMISWVDPWSSHSTSGVPGCQERNRPPSEQGSTKPDKGDVAGRQPHSARDAPWRRVLSGGSGVFATGLAIFADLGGIPFMDKSYLSF